MKKYNQILIISLLILCCKGNGQESNTVENETESTELSILKQTGIQATMNTDGKTMVLTYDHKTKAMEIKGGGMPNNAFMDTTGYMYVKVPQQGWVKMNAGKMLGKMPMLLNELPVNNVLNSTVSENISSVQETKIDGVLPIIDWPLRMTPELLAESPKFEKSKVNCSTGGGKCIQFIGKQGEAEGVRLLFNKKNRLSQLSHQGATIEYEYDNYNVQLPPNAKEFSFGG